MIKTLLNIYQDLHALTGKCLKTIYPQFMKKKKKKSLTLKKPIYVGFTILEITKWEMYSFHYNFMIRKRNARLLFTERDTLSYELYEKTPYKKCTSTKNYLI